MISSIVTLRRYSNVLLPLFLNLPLYSLRVSHKYSRLAELSFNSFLGRGSEPMFYKRPSVKDFIYWSIERPEPSLSVLIGEIYGSYLGDSMICRDSVIIGSLVMPISSDSYAHSDRAVETKLILSKKKSLMVTF